MPRWAGRGSVRPTRGIFTIACGARRGLCGIPQSIGVSATYRMVRDVLLTRVERGTGGS